LAHNRKAVQIAGTRGVYVNDRLKLFFSVLPGWRALDDREIPPSARMDNSVRDFLLMLVPMEKCEDEDPGLLLASVKISRKAFERLQWPEFVGLFSKAGLKVENYDMTSIGGFKVTYCYGEFRDYFMEFDWFVAGETVMQLSYWVKLDAKLKWYRNLHDLAATLRRM